VGSSLIKGKDERHKYAKEEVVRREIQRKKAQKYR
jgi:hypothetical protein